MAKVIYMNPTSDTCIALIKTHKEKYHGSASSSKFIDLSEVTLIHLSRIYELLCCHCMFGSEGHLSGHRMVSLLLRMRNGQASSPIL